MTINPYETLGVDIDASLAVIKKAFRALSMLHHPDKGGDPEDFAKIKLAYDVLMDTERRSRYDETGIIDETKATNGIDVEAIGAISNFFKQVMAIEGPNINILEADITEKIREGLRDGIRQAQQGLDKINGEIAKIAKMRQRFIRKSTKEGMPEGNLFEKQLDYFETMMQQNLARPQRDIEVFQRALAIMEEYDFMADRVTRISGFGEWA